MSGMIIGAKSSASRGADGRTRSTPSARRVPMTVEIAVDQTATMMEFHAAPVIFALAASAPYHSSEKPPQAVGMPDLLKDSTISTAIGR